jgi:hypothetical protein
MTTVFAIECKDGIILASDTQYTSLFREKGRKTWELRDNVVMGVAGANSYNYLFWRRLKEAFEKHEEEGDTMTLPDVIDEGILAFNAEMSARERLYKIKDDWRPQAVIAGFDEGLEGGHFVMFEVATPHTCLEVHSPYMRATAGSGGISATVFLRTIEDLMAEQKIEYTDLSWRLVAQLSFFLLARVAHLDPNSSGRSIIHVKEDDYDPLREGQIFKSRSYRSHLSEFLEGAVDEIGPVKTARFLKSIGMVPLLRSLSALSQKEPISSRPASAQARRLPSNQGSRLPPEV